MALVVGRGPSRTTAEAESGAAEEMRLAQLGLLVCGEHSVEGSVRLVLDGKDLPLGRADGRGELIDGGAIIALHCRLKRRAVGVDGGLERRDGIQRIGENGGRLGLLRRGQGKPRSKAGDLVGHNRLRVGRSCGRQRPKRALGEKRSRANGGDKNEFRNSWHWCGFCLRQHRRAAAPRRFAPRVKLYLLNRVFAET